MAKTVEFVIKADEADAIKAFNKLISKVKDVTEKVEDSGRKSRQVSSRTARAWKQSNEDAFGDQVLGRIAGYAAGVISITAAVGTLKGAWDSVNASRDEYARKDREAEIGLTSLAQLSGGDPKKFKALVAAAETTFAEGGAANIQGAAQQIFALESAGALDQRKLFSELFGVVGDPAALAKAAATIQTSVGAEAGGMREIVSRAFAASGFSPAPVEQLAEAAARGGPGLRAIGGDVNELLASTALLASGTGNAPEAGTQVRSFLRALGKDPEQRFRGAGLIGAVEQVEALKMPTLERPGLTTPELQKLLPDEAFAGFQILSRNIGRLREMTAAIGEAGEVDLTGQILAVRGRVPRTRAARDARMQAAKRDQANVQQGVNRNLTDAWIDAWARQREEEGRSRVATAIGESYMRGKRWLMGDDGMMNVGTEEWQWYASGGLRNRDILEDIRDNGEKKSLEPDPASEK